MTARSWEANVVTRWHKIVLGVQVTVLPGWNDGYDDGFGSQERNRIGVGFLFWTFWFDLWYPKYRHVDEEPVDLGCGQCGSVSGHKLDCTEGR